MRTKTLLVAAALVAVLALTGCLDALKAEAGQLRQDIALVDEKIEERAAENPDAPELVELRAKSAELSERLDALLVKIDQAETEGDVWTAIFDAAGAALVASVPAAAGPVGIAGAALASFFAVRERRRGTKIVRNVEAAKLHPSEPGMITVDSDKLRQLNEATGVQDRVRKARVAPKG